MANPMQGWKYQPWRSLLLSAGLAVGGLRALEAVLGLLVQRSALWEQFFSSLFQGMTGVMLVFLVYLGLGALAVLLLETRFSPGPIYSSTLWTLVFCIIISLLGLWLVEMFVAIPGLGLVGANEAMLIGVVIGVFIKGQQHWRY